MEYRAIKICGSTFAMDTLAEKFLLMKPVEPPFGKLKDSWVLFSDISLQSNNHIFIICTFLLSYNISLF